MIKRCRQPRRTEPRAPSAHTQLTELTVEFHPDRRMGTPAPASRPPFRRRLVATPRRSSRSRAPVRRTWRRRRWCGSRPHSAACRSGIAGPGTRGGGADLGGGPACAAGQSAVAMAVPPRRSRLANSGLDFFVKSARYSFASGEAGGSSTSSGSRWTPRTRNS